METGILQLFWVIVIVTIFAATLVKRLFNNKKGDQQARRSGSERKDIVRPEPGKRRLMHEWQDMVDDMLDRESMRTQQTEPRSSRRRLTEDVAVDENDSGYNNRVEEDETKDDEAGDMDADRVPSDQHGNVSEFHATIEDRHIKPSIDDVTANHSAIYTPPILSTSFEHEEKRGKIKKTRRSPIHAILARDGLRNAIIYAEIIGLPKGLKRKGEHYHVNRDMYRAIQNTKEKT